MMKDITQKQNPTQDILENIRKIVDLSIQIILQFYTGRKMIVLMQLILHH